MPGGRRVTLPQPASSVTLMLRSSAVLLGVVAALCWFAASRSSVQAPLLDGGGPARWWSLSWSLSVAGLGISVALLVWFAGRVGGRAGLLVLAAVLLGTMGAAAVFLRTVVPKPNLIHPIGSATPYAIAGFASAAAACLVAALTVVASGGWSTSTAERPTRRVRLRSAVLAVSMATLLATATGLVIVDRSRDYLLSVNEYRTAGDVDGEPAAAPASLLTGGDRWRIEVPGLTVSRPALTAYGIAVASGESVTMVDRATGAVRWRYARSDVTGVPSVASTGSGQQVLVWWGLDAVYVLDARTGDRVGHWPASDGRTSILDPALPLVARAGSGARTTIARVSSAGRAMWTHALDTCEQARATPADAVVVVEISTSCGPSSSRLVGLEATTGDELWSVDAAGDVRGVVPGGVVLVSPPAGEGARRMTVVDPVDGETLWSHELAEKGQDALACREPQVQARARVAMLVCSWDLTDYATGQEQYASTVHTFDARTGAALRTVTARGGSVIWTDVAADGRVLVGRTDVDDGWMIDAVTARGEHSTVSLGVDPTGTHSSMRLLTVFDDQVLVVDAGSEILRSLR